MTDTMIDVETVDTDTAGPDKAAHLVIGGVPAVMHGRLHGLPVTALCGHRFIPQKNPDDFPVCQACLEVNDYLPDSKGGDGIPGRWDGDRS